MSISDNYAPDVTTGNGVTAIFTGNWSPLVATYMRVYLKTIATGALGDPLDQGAGADEYTLSFSSSGYSITLGTAPSNAYQVVRAREIARTQAIPFTTAKGFQGAVHENAFDKVTAICQDLGDESDRSLKFPIATGVDSELPAPTALGLWRFNADADAIEYVLAADIDLELVTLFATQLLASDDGDEALALLGGAAATGTGAVVRKTSPVLVTPNLGVAAATSINFGDDALNAYKIGAAWTPVLTCTTPGNLTVAYSVQVGWYIKIGRLVIASFKIATSAFTHTSGESGNVIITGLPYAASHPNTSADALGVMKFQGITKANYTQFSLNITHGTQQMTINAGGSAQTDGAVQIADMPTGGSVVLSGMIIYPAA